MDINLEIKAINEVLKEYFKEDIYILFLEGYCLEYFNILKIFHPDAKMVLEKNKDHCAALIGDEVYDVLGKRNKDDFVLASSYDRSFVNDFYRHFDDTTKNNCLRMVRK